MGFHAFLNYVETSKLYETYPNLNILTYPNLNIFRKGKLLPIFGVREPKQFDSFLELSYSNVFNSIDEPDK